MSFGAGQPGTFSLSTITAGLPQNGNSGDVVNLGVGASSWSDNGKALDANGFYTYTQTFQGINLILKVEHNVVVH